MHVNVLNLPLTMKPMQTTNYDAATTAADDDDDDDDDGGSEDFIRTERNER